MTTPAVRLSNCTKQFGPITALDQIDLSIAPSTVHGVVGPNGAGKTTLMRLLVDLARPTSGRVEVLGESVREGGPKLRKRIGYLPGELRLNPRLRGSSVVDWFAQVQGGTRAANRALAERLDVDLDRRVGTLSKGNKQKLGLIQAFAHDPEVLILDEPTSGLDPLVQQLFLDLVRQARERGATVVLSSHVLSEIEQVADLCTVVRSGQIVETADVPSLRRTAVRHCRVQADGVSGDALTQRLARLPGVSRFTTVVRDEVAEASFTLNGHVNDLVAALQGWRVHDLVIGEPDLEEAVLAVYQPATANADQREPA